MKKVLAVAMAFASITGGHAQPSKVKLDSLMDYYQTEFGFNGTAFITMKGQTMLQKGYGYRSLDKKEMNDEHTIFQMGSNTKQFTAEIILQLAMQGKLSVENKLSTYFPEVKNAGKITIENLLTHTSGIYNYTDDSVWRYHLTST